MATLLLLDKTKQLLKQKSSDEIMIMVNELGLTYDWLIKLRSDKIKDPSVNKVQAVYEHLTGKPLFTE